MLARRISLLPSSIWFWHWYRFSKVDTFWRRHQRWVGIPNSDTSDCSDPPLSQASSLPKSTYIYNLFYTFISNKDFTSASPGDWLDNEGLVNKESIRYMGNLFKKEVASSEFANFYAKLTLAIFNCFCNERNVNDLRLPSSMEYLYKKIKLHFVNQPLLANFKEFPVSEKITYIGGLLVEQNKILIQEKVKAEDNEVIH
ncbi:unnamed protein product [Meloidogyne enterolobii]|uniref:Uncharacterized protein n=1 Tax=Meloidogyne enterolobii TaxID=390850 RepID=A0ACB0ZP26_MELEN